MTSLGLGSNGSKPFILLDLANSTAAISSCDKFPPMESRSSDNRERAHYVIKGYAHRRVFMVLMSIALLWKSRIEKKEAIITK